MQTVTDESGLKVSLAYDADGHVVKRSYSDGTSTSATYSDNGLLATTTDVTGAVTTYTYDSAGRMQTVTQRRGSAVLATVTYTYDAMSRVQTTTRGNGTTTTNTYTGRNQIATQTTTTATGALVESHAYTYDTHGNVARPHGHDTDGSRLHRRHPAPRRRPRAPGRRRTATTPTTGCCRRRRTPAPSQNPAPTPTTATSYTLDVDGDVVGTTTTTRRTVGGRPFVTTSRVTNTIDDAGQLTARTTDSAAPVPQVFDADGRLPAVADRCGDDVRRARPGDDRDGRRRDDELRLLAGRQPPAGHHHGPSGTGGQRGPTTLTYHYGPDGTLVNDSTDDTTTTGTTTVTASYLLTAGREARTLQAGTTATGALPTGAPAPTTTGAGVGYVLRDRHSSVTALVDSRGAVTNTYEYADYGAPALLDGRPAPLPAAAAGGRANPFTYIGAVPASSMTDALTGHLLLPARSYDPAQERFTSRDSANVFNRYQGFSTNPIGLVDLTGRISQTDIIIDVTVLAVLVLVAVITGGAAAIAIPAVVGAMAVGAAVATSAVVGAVATGVGAAAALLGAAVAATDLADDAQIAKTGTGFMSADTRKALQIVTYVAGAVAAVAGIAAVGAAAAGAVGATADAAAAAANSSWLEQVQDAADFADTEIGSSYADETSDLDGVDPRRFALVEGDQDDIMIHPGEKITSSVHLPAEGDDAASDVASAVLDGPNGEPVEPAPVSQVGSRSIPIRANVARGVLGGGNLSESDPVVFGNDPGLKVATQAAEDSDEEIADSLGTARSVGKSPPASGVARQLAG